LGDGVGQNYQFGDLNFDSAIDYYDAELFRAAYDQQNGAGAFDAMVAVPEPATALVACFALAIAGAGWLRRRVSARGASVALAALAMSIVLSGRAAEAQITYVDAV